MKTFAERHLNLAREQPDTCGDQVVRTLPKVRDVLGLASPRTESLSEGLPFSANDVTAGTETELQAAVAGQKELVDLPLTIQQSNYFANMLRRVNTGDADSETVSEIERFLNENSSDVWENSWVRFQRDRLNDYANEILESDLRSDKSNAKSPLRSDAHHFVFTNQGQEWLRIPISYLVKLALADFLGAQKQTYSPVVRIAHKILDKFLNDNTSPETVSFYIIPLTRGDGMGRAVAKETSLRFLLFRLLILYANHKFGLKEIGQQALVYLSPHPPLRQKKLSECVSDSFYRELFMSPCLSGWDDGEGKKAYMHLCHEVLSRSQLNATAKLRESGIMTRKLVFFPTLSSTSLSNNGTHLSLGSIKLTSLLRDEKSGFSSVHEKYVGDLVVKIVEHFLPLFVGLYSAAPYKLDFCDFHPEKALGFLPHELDYTHLRMIWRCWKQKARLRVLGHLITPFGVNTLDRLAGWLFRLRGDVVPDFRLIDYFVALMSTNRSPALDGTLGNLERLKTDLMSLGIFDHRLSPYLPCRLREFRAAGFSGFEGRHYSLFESLERDLAHAANLQNLIIAVAFKLVLLGRYTHRDIPDDPSTESERRQIFFGRAIGLPAFYVHHSTKNVLLRDIIRRTPGSHFSRRYARYVKVYQSQYQKTLVHTLVHEGEDLIDLLGVRSTVEDLLEQLANYDELSAAARLRKGIADSIDIDDPLRVTAAEFNGAAEAYYRTTLRRKHLGEALNFLKEDLSAMPGDTREAFRGIMNDFEKDYRMSDPLSLVSSRSCGLLEGAVSLDEIEILIALTLLAIAHNADLAERSLKSTPLSHVTSSSIH